MLGAGRCTIHGDGDGIQKECSCKRLPIFFSIYTAACYGDEENVRRHLDQRGNSAAESTDKYGFTALHYAAQGNHVVIVDLLLARGARPDGAPSSRCTPLHRAAAAGATATCSMLLESGANVDATDTSFGDCRTPLMKACAEGHVEVADLLASRGASLEATDATGMTPIDLAVPHPSVHSLLVNRGGTQTSGALQSKDSPNVKSAGSPVPLPLPLPPPLPTPPLPTDEMATPLQEAREAKTTAMSKDASSASTPRHVPSSFGMSCPICAAHMVVARRAKCCRALLCRGCDARVRSEGKCDLCRMKN